MYASNDYKKDRVMGNDSRLQLDINNEILNILVATFVLFLNCETISLIGIEQFGVFFI